MRKNIARQISDFVEKYTNTREMESDKWIEIEVGNALLIFDYEIKRGDCIVGEIYSEDVPLSSAQIDEWKTFFEKQIDDKYKELNERECTSWNESIMSFNRLLSYH